MAWDYLAIIIFLGLVMPLLGRRRVQRLLQSSETTTRDRLRLYASTIIMQWLLVAVILWRARVHGITPADLGLALPRPALTLAVSIGLGAHILANQMLALRMAAHMPDGAGAATTRELAARIFPQAPAERGVFFFVVVTVAICEELIYRGFLQHLFASFLGSTALGVLLYAALFSIAHLYQGRRGLLPTYVVDMLFGVVRFWTSNQIPGMIAHFIADIIAGFFLPARLRNIEMRRVAETASDA